MKRLKQLLTKKEMMEKIIDVASETSEYIRKTSLEAISIDDLESLLIIYIAQRDLVRMCYQQQQKAVRQVLKLWEEYQNDKKKKEEKDNGQG